MEKIEQTPLRGERRMDDPVAELRARQARAREMGGGDGLRRHRESGWLPVRERVAMLVDFKTFIQSAEGRPPVPRAAAILGPSYGDSALHASTAAFLVMTRSWSVALWGPSVVSATIAEEVTDAELGGPEAALAVGNAHLAATREVIATVIELAWGERRERVTGRWHA
ncbi:hypothetical protein LLG90_05170 [Aromatoleum toluclasticum]|uniref:carboxyl transferase domain-containing protein n=1 Tax=Aromatoleum toluclasticum TaxID=92003 RepID=UPI001D1801DB|nr:carboxyl transferase domain-containing protein [Aromatoleum toluclasticum]MCC4114738.1 hypothetical protein [Aromatoleum toluclasticum]